MRIKNRIFQVSLLMFFCFNGILQAQTAGKNADRVLELSPWCTVTMSEKLQAGDNMEIRLALKNMTQPAKLNCHIHTKDADRKAGQILSAKPQSAAGNGDYTFSYKLPQKTSSITLLVYLSPDGSWDARTACCSSGDLTAAPAVAASENTAIDNRHYDEHAIAYTGIVPAYPCIFGDIDPESSSCDTFYSASACGWDAARRSIVIDLGRSKVVNKILLLNNLVKNPDMKCNLDRNSIMLYHSNDNKKYSKYTEDFNFDFRKAAATEDAYDVIELSGFEIFSRYIKVAHTYDGLNFHIGNKNTQKLCRAFALSGRNASISRIINDEYLVSEKSRIGIELSGSPEAWNGGMLKVNIGNIEAASQKLSSACRRYFLEVDLGKVKPGHSSLDISLLAEDNTVIAVRRKGIDVYHRIIDDRMLEENAKIEPDDVIILKNISPPDGDWTRKNYQMVNSSQSGELLVAQQGQSRDLVYSPKISGYYAIYFCGLSGSRLNVKLASEKDFSMISIPDEDVDNYICETFWRCARLDNPSFIIQKIADSGPSSLAYIKLIPLNEEQIQRHENPDAGRKTVILNDDGFSSFYFARFSDRPSLEKFVDDKFKSQISFGIGVSTAFNYNSKVGDVITEKSFTGAMRKGDYTACALIKKMLDNGDVPAKIVIDRAHKNQVKAFIDIRMNNCAHMQGTFFRNHPEWRIVTNSSMDNKFLSFFFPEVRQFYLEVIKEVAALGPDGINLDFMRDPLFFGYEKPLTDGFARKYGIKNDAVSPLDPAWLHYKAEFITRLLRDVRYELNKTGSKIKISVRIPGTLKMALEKGLDIDKWIKERLVDAIIPDLSAHDQYYDISEFTALVRDTDIKLCPNLDPTVMGRDPSADDEKPGAALKPKNETLNTAMIKIKVAGLYRDGAYGVQFFNFLPAPALQYELMNGDELLNWAEFGNPERNRKQEIIFISKK